jgi:TonB family protein
MRRWIVGLALALATACGTAAADPAPPAVDNKAADGPHPTVITNPDWIQTPNGDDFANFYPKLASMLGVGGRAITHCGVSIQGLLVNCTIVDETPAGMGFGPAALSMMTRFHMRPQLRDGKPVDGGTINIPIRFAPPDSEDDASASQPGALNVADVNAALAAPVTPPTPQALALAQQLADAQHLPEQLQMATLKAQGAVRDLAADTPDSPARQAAIDALVQAEKNEGQAMAQWYVNHYAQKFSEKELTDMVTFFKSSAGQDWMAENTQMALEAAQTMQDQTDRVEADARRLFCQKITCYKPASAPADAAPPK